MKQNTQKQNKNMLAHLFAAVFFVMLLSAPHNASAAALAKPANNLGLVGYWSFNDATSTSATDFSGNGNTGTLTNMANPATATSGWGNGKLGGGLNFDGTNDYVALANGLGSNFAGGKFTLSAWVYVHSTSGTTNSIIKNWGTSAVGAFHFDLANQKLTIYISQSNGAAIGPLQSSATVPLNEWHHVVAIADGAVLKLYLDGSQSGSSLSYNGTLLTSNNYTDIGAKPSDSGGADAGTPNYLNGSIDEVRIYSRALSATEVTALYNSGSAKVNAGRSSIGGTLDQGLLGYWSFDGKDISGTTAYDRSGNGNNGTLTNGPVTTIGKIGQALNFDGSNDYVNVSSPSLYTSQGSMSVWVKPLNFTTNQSLFSSGSSENDIFQTGITTSGQVYVQGFLNPSNNAMATGVNTVTAGQWNHIVITSNGSTWTIYINGVSQTLSPLIGSNTGNWTNLANTGFLNWGYLYPYGYAMRGTMDEARLYNRTLSATEVKALYNLGAEKINASRNATDSSLDSGLVGLWSFDGKDMNGTTAYDRSGSGNNGTLTNGPATTIGKMGQGLSFDGVNDTVTMGYGGLPVGTSDRTFSAWVKSTAVNGKTLFSYGASVGGQGFFVYTDFQFNTGRWVVDDYGEGYQQGTHSNTVINDGKWHMITFVLSSGGQLGTYYTDGAPDGSHIYVINGFGAQYFNTAGSGSTPTIGAGSWNGSIDDVRIYNRTLSADEVKLLYNMGK